MSTTIYYKGKDCSGMASVWPNWAIFEDLAVLFLSEGDKKLITNGAI